MNEFTKYQMFTSFTTGGCLVTILSLLSERVGKKASGVILMFPSTSILGFYFLGLATSPSNVASIIPTVLVPLGIVVLSSVIYIHIAMWISNSAIHKTVQIVLTFILSSICWFLLAVPFAFWRMKSIWIGTIGYLLLAGLAHYLLHLKEASSVTSRKSYSGLQILFRALIYWLHHSYDSVLGTTIWSNLGWPFYHVSGCDLLSANGATSILSAEPTLSLF